MYFYAIKRKHILINASPSNASPLFTYQKKKTYTYKPQAFSLLLYSTMPKSNDSLVTQNHNNDTYQDKFNSLLRYEASQKWKQSLKINKQSTQISPKNLPGGSLFLSCDLWFLVWNGRSCTEGPFTDLSSGRSLFSRLRLSSRSYDKKPTKSLVTWAGTHYQNALEAWLKW